MGASMSREEMYLLGMRAEAAVELAEGAEIDRTAEQVEVNSEAGSKMSKTVLG